MDAETKNRFKRIANNSKFTVLTLGGDAKVLRPDSLGNLPDVIKKGMVFSASNPGLPIAYTVAFLRDNQLATMSFTTDYVETECTQYPNGYVKLSHRGAYVARWEVTWNEKNSDGQSADRKWESGKITSPWQRTIDLPGDAYNVRIKGWSATGLVWDPWREAIHRGENGPTNKCYRITGTTLAPRWDQNCT